MFMRSCPLYLTPLLPVQVDIKAVPVQDEKGNIEKMDAPDSPALEFKPEVNQESPTGARTEQSEAKVTPFPKSGCGASPQAVFRLSFHAGMSLSAGGQPVTDLPPKRSFTTILVPHKECSHAHSLCHPFTSAAAPSPRPSGNSSTTAGTSSSPTTNAPAR